MTTTLDLMYEMERDNLLAYARPIYDVAAASFTDSASSIQLSYTSNLSPGAVLEVGQELMTVVAWSGGSKTATVIRGFLGSSAAAGSGGAVVRINPRFPQRSMLDVLRNEMASWDQRVFAVHLVTVPFTAAYDTALLDTTGIEAPYRVLHAYLRPPTSASGYRRKRMTLRLRRNEDVSQFASGFSVQALDTFAVDVDVDVLLACPFLDPATLTVSTDLTAAGVPAGLLEVLKWGALSRLVSGREASRLDSQAMARADVAQAVPANANLQAGAQYFNLRNMAYDREARRLQATYGVAMVGA